MVKLCCILQISKIHVLAELWRVIVQVSNKHCQQSCGCSLSKLRKIRLDLRNLQSSSGMDLIIIITYFSKIKQF